MVTGVFPQTELPPRSSSLPPPNQKYPDHIVEKLLESLRNVTQQNIGLPILPHCQQLCLQSTDGMTYIQAFRRRLHDKPRSIP